MQLVIGLGNPGPAYAETRHNAGFMVLDELARRRRLTFRAHGPYATAADAGGALVLLKPLTYMNLSGGAVLAWLHATGFGVALPVQAPEPRAGRDGTDPAAPSPGGDAPSAETAAGGETPARSLAHPLVVCDDLALPLGTLRLRARGSDGGQKGLASIIATLGSEEIPRLRLGIDGTGGRLDPAEWADYVLEPFSAVERPLARELVGHAADAVSCLLAEGLETAAARFNRRAAPPA